MSQAADKLVRALVQLLAAIENDPRSVEEIARASGVDRNTIWFWKRGQTTNPNIAQVDKVARATGFSLELVPRTSNKTPDERRETNRRRGLRRGLTSAQAEQFLEQERERSWRKPRRRSPEQLEQRRNYSREFMRKLRAARKEERVK